MDQVYVKPIFWIRRRTKVASNQSNIRSSEAEEYPVRVGRSKLIQTNLIKTDIDFFTNLTALVRLMKSFDVLPWSKNIVNVC